MNNPVKLFVVEGEDRDCRFVQGMTQCFFATGKYQAKVINLPASQNIYMLYQLLQDDDFETDIVELLRDNVKTAGKILEGITRQDIDEVYLFFDYDIHQNNLPRVTTQTADEILESMIKTFDNETDNGKLYISYPMVEALYDYKTSMCESYSGCYVPIESLSDYKTIVGEGNPNANVRFEIEEWKEVISIFILRVQCLFDLDEVSFYTYRKLVFPESINKKETSLKNEYGKVFVLSALPEFILDYFRENFWNSMVKRKRKAFDDCPKKA